MSRLAQPQTVIRVKPQANVYTVLLLVVVLALGTAIGVAIWNLTEVYGLTFGDIFAAAIPK